MNSTINRVNSLQKSAAELLKAVKYTTLQSRSLCLITPFFTVIDDSYNIAYYPHGVKDKSNCLSQMNLTAMQIKAFVEDIPPDTDFVIDWTACVEWLYFNKTAIGSPEREHYLKLFPPLANIPIGLNEFFVDLPPRMRYVNCHL